MAYQSLYRKWRPQTFAAMVGQEHVARTLANAVREERMAHAYLFTGPRGTGKTSAARLFAKALNCTDRLGAEPCDRCPSCVAIREGRSLDVLEIDGASNRGIDEIRELRERAGMAATTGRFRFYIIDEVHQLTEAAFNALLKTLEEPPAHIVFILATTDAHKVPATISSRCQHFAFHRISTQGLTARVEEVAGDEGYDLEPAALWQVVQVADGSLRDALSLLDQAVSYCGPTISAEQLSEMLGLVPEEAVREFAGYLRERDAAAAVQLPGRLADAGADLRQFNHQLLDHLRGLLAARAQNRPEAKGWDLPHLLGTIRLFAAIDFSARLNVVPQLPLELAGVEACTAPLAVAPLPQAAAPAAVPPAAVPPAAPRQPGAPLRPASVASPSPNGRAERPGATEAAPIAPLPGADGVLQAQVVSAPPPFERQSVAAAGVPDDLRRKWEQVLARVPRANPPVQALLNSLQFLGLEDGAVVLDAGGKQFLQERLNAPKTRSLIEGVVQQVFGEPLMVRYSLTGEGRAPASATVPPAAPARDLLAEAKNDPTVRMTVEAFGGRVESVTPAGEARPTGEGRTGRAEHHPE